LNSNLESQLWAFVRLAPSKTVTRIPVEAAMAAGGSAFPGKPAAAEIVRSM
jgi:hypothetical protein